MNVAGIEISLLEKEVNQCMQIGLGIPLPVLSPEMHRSGSHRGGRRRDRV